MHLHLLTSGLGIARTIVCRSVVPHLGALSVLGVLGALGALGALGGARGGAWMGWLVNPPPVLALPAPAPAPAPVLALSAPAPVLALSAPAPVLTLSAPAPVLALSTPVLTLPTGALFQMTRYGAAYELGILSEMRTGGMRRTGMRSIVGGHDIDIDAVELAVASGCDLATVMAELGARDMTVAELGENVDPRSVIKICPGDSPIRSADIYLTGTLPNSRHGK